MVKNQPASAGDMDLIPGSGRSPAEGNDNPLQYSCLEDPMDREALVGYSPWGCKVLHLSEHAHMACLLQMFKDNLS